MTNFRPERSLITIATFTMLDEAQVVRARLDAEGIYTHLANETTARNLWHMANAVGGLRLQVAVEDAERARALLDPGSVSETPGDEPDELLELDEPVAPDAVAREKQANRAFRAALFGFFVPGLFVILSVFALVDFWKMTGEVTPRARRLATTALILDAITVGFYVSLVIVARALR